MIGISYLPMPAHQGCAISTVAADAAGMALISRLRRGVHAYNMSVASDDRVYVKVMGRLGKKNAAYAKYDRHYAFVRKADAVRFDLYVNVRNYYVRAWQENVAFVKALLCRGNSFQIAA